MQIDQEQAKKIMEALIPAILDIEDGWPDNIDLFLTKAHEGLEGIGVHVRYDYSVQTEDVLGAQVDFVDRIWIAEGEKVLTETEKHFLSQKNE